MRPASGQDPRTAPNPGVSALPAFAEPPADTTRMSVEDWARSRLPSNRVHLDAAACGRLSATAYDEIASHLQAEASGGNVAEAENRQIPQGRRALGELVGLGPDQVAFTESGAAAFARLLEAWPLDRGARIGTVPSEFGGNALVLHRLATERGWTLVMLPVDPLGRIAAVPSDLDLVTFPQVASQRGVAQPVEFALAAGPPVLLDVAQALGQTPVPHGCAAYMGTSRKWLCGPRGVGFAVIDDDWARHLNSPAALRDHVSSPAARYESSEGNIAGRAGLSVAAQEWTPALISTVHELAAQLRAHLADLPGWRVVEPVDEPTGITTLIGGDPAPLRSALLDLGFVTSVVPNNRAADMTGALLRISTHAWLTPTDLERFAAALRAVA